MIKFEERPPKSPDHVTLTGEGIAIIAETAQAQRVPMLLGYRLENANDMLPRLMLVGSIVRSTIAANMDPEDTKTDLLLEIVAGVAKQLREGLTNDEGILSEENRSVARGFAAGLGGYTLEKRQQEVQV